MSYIMNSKHFKYLDKVIDDEVKFGNVKGARVSVICNGKRVYDHDSGYANKNIPYDENTIIRLFSMSKPVTAVAAMILFERGLLDVMKPVSYYLPYFKDNKVYVEAEIESSETKGKHGVLVDAKRPVLVNDLLNMTSPVCYPDGTPGNIIGNRINEIYDKAIEGIQSGNEISTRDFVKALSEVPLAFQPGERWQYSASADILGAVIEEISGKRFGEFLHDEIFAPLGMNDTGFFVPEDKLDRFADAFIYDPEKKCAVPYSDFNLAVGDWTKAPAFESGGAGLVSTMKDYEKFMNMLLGYGTYVDGETACGSNDPDTASSGVRILGRKTVEYMCTNQLTSEQKKTMDWDSLVGYGYGNLVRVLESKAKACTHSSEGEYGWDGWMGSYFCIDPEDDLGILIFLQLADDPNTVTFRRKLRQVVFGALDEKK